MFAAIGSSLFALQEKDGDVTTLWRHDTGAPIPASPVIANDGSLRVHSGDGKLHAVDTDGKAVWEPAEVGEPLGWATPMVDGDDNTFVSLYGGGLTKVMSSGMASSRAFLRSRQKFDSTGVIYEGHLYIGGEDGFVYAVDITGTRGKQIWDHLADQGKTDWFINSGPAVTSNHHLVIAGRDEHLYVFDMNGAQRGKVHIRGQMLASPVIGDDNLAYVGVSLVRSDHPPTGQLICVDLAAQQIRWQYEAGAPVESTPVIGDDGIVYCGDNAGEVHAVSSLGEKVWSKNVGNPVRSAGTIAGPNRLVFGLDNGMLAGLRCSSESLAQSAWPKFMGGMTHRKK